MKNFAFLMWAYIIIWAGLGAYLLFLVLRLRKVSGRLDRIERKLSSGGGREAGQ